MEKYNDWDSINIDTWDEEALFKRNDYYNFKDKINTAGNKVSDAANTAGNKVSDAANTAGDKIFNVVNNVDDTINNVVYGDEQTGEGGIVNKISGTWNDTKAHLEQTKETIDTAKKILSYIPIIFGFLFFLFIICIAFIIYLCFRRHQKAKLQRQQIKDLTIAIREINSKNNKDEEEGENIKISINPENYTKETNQEEIPEFKKSLTNRNEKEEQ